MENLTRLENTRHASESHISVARSNYEGGRMNSAGASNSNQRLLRFLQATPQQLSVIDRILEGKIDVAQSVLKGPLLLGMGTGAALLGVSRATLWRMIRNGKIARVEILPGSFRVRRAELEAIGEVKSHSSRYYLKRRRQEEPFASVPSAGTQKGLQP